MKRTPLKRSAPLRARKRLRRKRYMNRVGKRGKRERAARELFKKAVRERADGRCARCGGRRKEMHAHHVKPLGRNHDADRHNPNRGILLCGGPGGCHSLIHDRIAEDWRDWIR